ncbi:hypothetical protein [Mycobacterium sp.]|uniref:hypothetical protein n=1 Tax=Mycobacterium sp. TaxID=1785 RepID=UPI00260D460D|nr:hypothetical protein [Mycobacterium sp.]
MTLVQLAAILAVIVGAGGAGAVLQKAVRSLRRLGRVADGILGDGTKDHPGVIAGQAELKAAVDELKTQAAGDLADIRADLAAVKADVGAVKEQTAAIETKLDEHVDTVAPSLLADGQRWGAELQAASEDNTRRIAALEAHTGTDDPVVGS